MVYKDSKLEIDDTKMMFKNGVFIPFLIIFTSSTTFSFIFSKGDIFQLTGTIVGLIIGFVILRMFVGMYLKNTIDLSSIDYVKIQVRNKDIDKGRNFWGTGKFKYYFPTGINKKANPEVIFVHIKMRKAAVGFVPENMDNVITVLNEKGIRIIDDTIK